MNETKYIGVDLSKLEIVADLATEAAPRVFANDAEGRAGLIQQLPAHAQVVCESTGGYQRPLVAALHASGVPVSVVMPGRVRAFARAQGLRAKTDPIDARLLSAFGQAMALRPQPPPAAAQLELQELMRARHSLVAQLNDEASQAEHCRLAVLQLQRTARIKFLRRQIRAIEEQVRTRIRANPQWQRRLQRAQEVCGIGEVSAWIVLSDLPELGQLERGQAAALLGVAPDPDDSGPRQGRRHISGGRHIARKVLYMAAITASQKNSVLAPFYRRLVDQRHKPKRVALTAVMRKLVELLNHMFAHPDFTLAS